MRLNDEDYPETVAFIKRHKLEKRDLGNRLQIPNMLEFFDKNIPKTEDAHNFIVSSDEIFNFILLYCRLCLLCW